MPGQFPVLAAYPLALTGCRRPPSGAAVVGKIRSRSSPRRIYPMIRFGSLRAPGEVIGLVDCIGLVVANVLFLLQNWAINDSFCLKLSD
jgi:hypothetical protein